MNTTNETIQRHSLLEECSLDSLWTAAHELAKTDGIPYPAARMRIVRQLARSQANLAEGKQPFEPRSLRGGSRKGAGRKKLKT